RAFFPNQNHLHINGTWYQTHENPLAPGEGYRTVLGSRMRGKTPTIHLNLLYRVCHKRGRASHCRKGLLSIRSHLCKITGVVGVEPTLIRVTTGCFTD